MTVLSELRRQFGDSHYVYLGDTANVPYGTKSSAQVQRLAAACGVRLKERGVDCVVVACNTASSLALPEVREAVGAGTPVIGVIEAGVLAAQQALQSQPAGSPVLVLATKATVKSGLYGRLLRERGVKVHEQACPLLVPMIEEGWTDHPILCEAIEHYVRPYRNANPTGVVLLGCTHYPWIQSAVQRAMPGWMVVSSAETIAHVLQSAVGLKSARGPSTVDWIFTDPDAIPEFVLPLE